MPCNSENDSWFSTKLVTNFVLYGSVLPDFAHSATGLEEISWAFYGNLLF